MKNLLKSLALVSAFASLASAPTACQPSFPVPLSTQRLSATLETTNLGTPNARLPISLAEPTVFTIDVEALDASGNPDPSFNGFVRVSVVPGTVLSVSGVNTDGRNVQLQNGAAKGVRVAVLESYGDTRIWVDDVGYVPADPLGVPQCANGLDDNHNGKIDFPNDPGCFAANDDTEDGGSYAAAVTDTIFFSYPTISDVRGLATGGTGTPFPYQQVQIDTRFSPSAPQGVVVTGVGSAGFFVTDLSNPGGQGYNSVYAYTYTAPPIMLPCDRLVTFGGTAADFYGFTELNFPTWSLDEWDPTVRPCLVPPATSLNGTIMVSGSLVAKASTGAVSLLRSLEASLVQVSKSSTTWLKIPAHFGPGLVQQDPMTKAYVPTAENSNCDYNGDGKIDFTNGSPEYDCANACAADLQDTSAACKGTTTIDCYTGCAEYTQYLSYSNFPMLIYNSSAGVSNTLLFDLTADPSFDPVQHRGSELGALTGELLYFSGGTQFTIQARCADDLVISPTGQPMPTDKACVVARNAADLTNAN